MPMLEAIEQRATAQGVSIDHASSAAAPIATPSLDSSTARASTASSSRRRPKPAPSSLAMIVWLLEKAPAEVLILRPGPEDRRFVTANGRSAQHS
jgi:hypothetical protein